MFSNNAGSPLQTWKKFRSLSYLENPVTHVGMMNENKRSKFLLRAAVAGIRMATVPTKTKVSWLEISQTLPSMVALGAPASECMTVLAVCHNRRVRADVEDDPFVEAMSLTFLVARSQAKAAAGPWATSFAKSAKKSCITHVGHDELRSRVALSFAIAVLECDDAFAMEQILEQMDDLIEDTAVVLLMERAVTRAFPSCLELIMRRRPESVARLLRNLDARCSIDYGYEGLVSVDVHPFPLRKKRERVQKTMAVLLSRIARRRPAAALRHLLCGALTTCCTFKFSHRSIEAVLWEAGGRGSRRVSDIIPPPVLDRCLKLLGAIFPGLLHDHVNATNDDACISITLKDPFSYASAIHALRVAGASFSEEVQTTLVDHVGLCHAFASVVRRRKRPDVSSSCYGLCAYLLREAGALIPRLAEAVLNTGERTLFTHGASRLQLMVYKGACENIDGLRIEPPRIEKIRGGVEEEAGRMKRITEAAWAPHDVSCGTIRRGRDKTRKGARKARKVREIREANGGGGIGYCRCMRRFDAAKRG